MAHGYTFNDNNKNKEIFRQKRKKTFKTIIGRSANYKEYLITSPKKGKCYIFNHKFFSLHEVRAGTDEDANSLYNQFSALGFETEIFTNFSIMEIYEKLDEVSNEDHYDSSCFVCCILTYGERGYLYASDGEYRVENVLAPFASDVCLSLANKPKIFIIQACQGGWLDPEDSAITEGTVEINFPFRKPIDSDFLIVCSTIPGSYAWSPDNCYWGWDNKEGSWFIQTLCECIEEYAEEMDLLSILTLVNQKLVNRFETNNKVYVKKQMPIIACTLTRDLRFL